MSVTNEAAYAPTATTTNVTVIRIGRHERPSRFSIAFTMKAEPPVMWNLITAVSLILGGGMYGFFAGPRSNANAGNSSSDGSNGGLKCHTTSASETAKLR